MNKQKQQLSPRPVRVTNKSILRTGLLQRKAFTQLLSLSGIFSLKSNGKRLQAFTLVELIVVITILAILGTIAFISLQGYSKTSRDSVRISDTSSMKTSLELFHLNAGKYPLPDEYGTFKYLGNDLFYQGYFGDNVIQNLSRNINKVPLDPLTERRYIYSVTANKNELEILNLLEGDDITLNTTSKTNAAGVTVTPKITGNYNGLFAKTPTHLVPIPSIINTELENNTDTEITQGLIESMVTDSGENIPTSGNVESNSGALTGLVLTGITIPETDASDATKAAVIEIIKSAYIGETALNNRGIYNYILNEDEDTAILAGVYDTIVLGRVDTSTSSITSTDGTCGTASKEYLYSDISYGTDTHCGDGEVTGGGTPVFPSEGGNTIWTCDGLDGGSISNQCEATRTVNPFPATCGNGDVVTYQEAQDNKSTIISSINNYIGCEINDYPGTSIPGSGVYIAGLTNSSVDIMVVAKIDSGYLFFKNTQTLTVPSINSQTNGLANTDGMVTEGISSFPAGNSCRNIGNNWYLPAKNELNVIYINRLQLGTFSLSRYWSSSEVDARIAWLQDLGSGEQSNNYLKNFNKFVRCASRF